MRTLIRFLLKFIIFWVAMWAVGFAASRAFEGDSKPDDDDFRLLGLVGGKAVKSRATALRRVTAMAVLGGIDLDLSRATLDPGGAHLELKVTVGGMRVAVPASWRVIVADDVMGGAVEVTTPPPDQLPDDAPTLTVDAVVRSGGIVIEAVNGIMDETAQAERSAVEDE